MALFAFTSVLDITSSEGTGTFTVDGTPPGEHTKFSDALKVGEVFLGRIYTQEPPPPDPPPGPDDPLPEPFELQFEVGEYTWIGSNQFTRAGRIINSSNANAVVDFLPGVKEVAIVAYSLGPTKLVTNATRYVRTNGNNNNTGKTNDAAGAWLTPQVAIDKIWNEVDFNGFDVLLHVEDGTYVVASPTLGVMTIRGPFIDSTNSMTSSMSIVGNDTTPANVVLQTSAAAGSYGIGVFDGARVNVSGFKISSLTGIRVQDFVVNDPSSYIGLGVIQYAVTGKAVDVSGSGDTWIDLYGKQTVLNGMNTFIYGEYAKVRKSGAGEVVLTSNPAFSNAFIEANYYSEFKIDGIVFTGTATGVRYRTLNYARILVGGAGENYLPGNSPGVKNIGGAYDGSTRELEDILTQINTPVVDILPGFIKGPLNQDYRIIERVPKAMTVSKFWAKTATGTVTVALKINTTLVTGGSINATSSQSSATPSATNVMAIGTALVLTCSSANATDLSFVVELTRPLIG